MTAGLNRVERVVGQPACASVPAPLPPAGGELTAPRFPAGGELPEARADLAELLALAGATIDRAWRIGTDIAYARNAHFTNTRAELAAALHGAYDWFEGDVTVEPDGTPVMRHDPGGRFDLDLRSWLAVLRVSGRGAKIDLKASAALPRVLALVRASGIAQERLIINVDALPLAQLRMIRRALPEVMINVNPPRDGTAELEPADIVRLQLAARAVGGRVMFPIRIDLLTQGVVDALRPFGRVATWNWPGLTNSGAGDVRRARALGVDGMVDLRSSRGVLQTLSATIAEAVATLVGWPALHRQLDPFD